MTITVGTGSGPGAFLTHGTRANIPAVLTTQKTGSTASFHFRYKSSNATADNVVARGVTGSGSALILWSD